MKYYTRLITVILILCISYLIISAYQIFHYTHNVSSQLSKHDVSNASTTVTVKGGWTKQTFTPMIKEEQLKKLTPDQYKVTQEQGTEAPFQNEYYNNHEKGIYVDIVSGEPLYLSSDKYDSGTGWPSFTKPVKEDAITLHADDALLSSRTEVRSAVADSHLGHVFDDGPKDKGGKRYCMNSAAMKFIPFSDMEKEGYGEFMKLFPEDGK